MSFLVFRGLQTPRIGPLYQAQVAPRDVRLSRRNKSQQHTDESNLFWSHERAFDAGLYKTEKVKPDDKNQESNSFETGKNILDEYLAFVKGLFKDPEFQFCQERALYFLHKCGYDVEAAKVLLDLSFQDDSDNEEFNSEDDSDDDECTICLGGNGALVPCDYEGCPKMYHMKCLTSSERYNERLKSGKEFICEWHLCSVCSKDAISGFRCSLCTTSYCDSHLPDELRTLAGREDLCEFFCVTCLKKVEGNSKSNSNKDFGKFSSRLEDFLSKKNCSLPTKHKDLNLFSLYRAVTRRGGLSNVINHVGWRGVLAELNLSPSSSNSTQVRQHYMKYLYLYEKKHFNGAVPSETLKNLWLPSFSGKRNENVKKTPGRLLKKPDAVAGVTEKQKKRGRSMAKEVPDVSKTEFNEKLRQSRSDRLSRRSMQRRSVTFESENEEGTEKFSNPDDLNVKEGLAEIDSLGEELLESKKRKLNSPVVEVPSDPNMISLEKSVFVKQLKAYLQEHSISQAKVSQDCNVAYVYYDYNLINDSPPSLSNFLYQKPISAQKEEILFKSLREWLINHLQSSTIINV